MTFKIGDEVTSPINNRFKGIVTGIIKCDAGKEYRIAYFNSDGVSVSSDFDKCELKSAKSNGKIGFKK